MASILSSALTEKATIYLFHATCPVSFPPILQYLEQPFFRLHLYLQKAISVCSGYIITTIFNKQFYKLTTSERLNAEQFFTYSSFTVTAAISFTFRNKSDSF